MRGVSRRRGTQSWPEPSIWNLTWAAAVRRMNMAVPRTRNCRLSPRELYEITRLASGNLVSWAILEKKRKESKTVYEDDYCVLLIY